MALKDKINKISAVGLISSTAIIASGYVLENKELFGFENAKFTSFEFSARIVAGSNIYMDGSPYYSLLFNENMSMGKRIAREIKIATEKNELDKITT